MNTQTVILDTAKNRRLSAARGALTAEFPPPFWTWEPVWATKFRQVDILPSKFEKVVVDQHLDGARYDKQGNVVERVAVFWTDYDSDHHRYCAKRHDGGWHYNDDAVDAVRMAIECEENR